MHADEKVDNQPSMSAIMIWQKVMLIDRRQAEKRG